MPHDTQLKDLYSKGVSLFEISQTLGLSERTIIRHARRLGIEHPNQHGKIGGGTVQEAKMAKDLSKDEVVQVIKAESAANVAREAKLIAERKYKLLQKEYNDLRRRFDEALDYQDRSPTYYHIKRDKGGSSHQAVPCLVLSDWHVEERVEPRTIGGKNNFTLKVAKRRAENVFQNTLKRIDEVKDEVDISDVAVFLLGDFTTGHIHLENIENAQLGKLDAQEYAEELLRSGIYFLLRETPYNFTFYCKVGNHSRTTQKVHASTEWQNSVEPFMYWSLKREFEREFPDRVKFEMKESYISTTNILGTKVRYHHGHAVSYGGGVGGLHIPLRKAIKSWNETSHADVDFMGHYHSFLEHSTFKYVVNGSLIGYNGYAERIKVPLEAPLQGFALIHQDYGIVRLSPLYAE